ncbi:MAG: VOC family protein [Mycobacterium leprae]
MIGNITTVGIQCTDLEASKRFYSEKLGLQLVAGGRGWAVLNGGTVSISLWQGATPATVIGFDGGKLEEIRTALEAEGISAGDPEPHPGGRHFNVFDPDGNRVMISVL